MSCCGDREKGKISEYQKWDYITLSDFKSNSCGTTFSYGWLWFLAIIAVAVYAADTYTAVSLLVFNHWSSQIKPTVPFAVSKWIFAICILLSWFLAGYEWIRAFRVMQRNSVAKDYLDPLASRLQSMHVGSGQGWRRFLVFAELTKSRKGADYIALFVYFQLKGSVRVLLAEGPRQVINALTLYSVMQANLLPNGADKDHSPFVQFWINVKIMGQTQGEHAAILFTMLFTLVIWIFSFVCFVLALVLYITFLWHYIPSGSGGVSGYCRQKVEKRLAKIVASKVEKAVEKAGAKRRREEIEAMRTGRPMPPPEKRPTLPSLFGDNSDASSMTTTLSRKPTQSTLPPLGGFQARHGSGDENIQNSQPHLPKLPTLPTIADRPDGPVRTDTQSSGHSGISDMSDGDRPLLSAAAGMGAAAPNFGNYAIANRPPATYPKNLRRNASAATSLVSPMTEPHQSPWASSRQQSQRKPLPGPAISNFPPTTPTFPPQPRKPMPGHLTPQIAFPARSMTAGPTHAHPPLGPRITRNLSLVPRSATAGPALNRHVPAPPARSASYEMQARPSLAQAQPQVRPSLAYTPAKYEPLGNAQGGRARHGLPYDGRIIDDYR